jgi:hypothetical protein
MAIQLLSLTIKKKHLGLMSWLGDESRYDIIPSKVIYIYIYHYIINQYNQSIDMVKCLSNSHKNKRTTRIGCIYGQTSV